MGRSDINTLSVSFEPVRQIEFKPEIKPAAAPAASLLVDLECCPSCDSKLSKPEAKMGRCLSCGTKLQQEQGGEQQRSFTIGI
ncbi:hypothetical protein KDL44_08180 [bacterium]|nr:hypothetical protein [bacterium]